MINNEKSVVHLTAPRKSLCQTIHHIDDRLFKDLKYNDSFYYEEDIRYEDKDYKLNINFNFIDSKYSLKNSILIKEYSLIYYILLIEPSIEIPDEFIKKTIEYSFYKSPYTQYF